MIPLNAILKDLEKRLTALEEAAEPKETMSDNEAAEWRIALFAEIQRREKLEREVSSLESIILEQDEALHKAALMKNVLVATENRGEELERKVSDLEATIEGKDIVINSLLETDKQNAAYKEAANKEIARLRSSCIRGIFPDLTTTTITGP